jgi:predicted Zn finger-like uncharacterized protein
MVITVTCPSCAATFPVDTNKVPAAGVNARCSSCRYVFRVERPAEPAPTEPAFVPPPPPPPVEYWEPEPPPADEAPALEPLPTLEPLPALEPFPTLEPLPTSRTPELPEEEPYRETDTDFSVGAAEAPAAEARDWVFEHEERIDPGTLEVQPMEAAEPAPFAPPPFETAPPPPPAPGPVHPGVGSFTFGKRDPTDKARRLARVLVSDMIMYNPKRHEQALANGTLKQDFEDEIAKSWKEYVEQVGEEMATGNTFWADALNDVLAKGQKIF